MACGRKKERKKERKKKERKKERERRKKKHLKHSAYSKIIVSTIDMPLSPVCYGGRNKFHIIKTFKNGDTNIIRTTICTQIRMG